MDVDCTGEAFALVRLADLERHAGGTLAPGKSLHHEVDLAWWVQQEVNGRRPLPTGKATLFAAYEVTGEPGVRNGRIEVPAIDVSW